MKQLSIFLENKQGALVDVLRFLKEANIQIIASTIAETEQYGIYRVICDNPEQAYIVLKEQGIAVNLTEMKCVELADKPGGAAEAIEKIVAEGVNKLRTEETSCIVITHYDRLLEMIRPDVVHVLYQGRIVKTAGPELAKEIQERGYDWIKEEIGEG